MLKKKISISLATALLAGLALAPGATAYTPIYLTTTQKAQLKYLIEEVDIASLKELLAKAMPADVKIALELLLAASYNHLEAFTY
jgi:hypothetical protein